MATMQPLANGTEAGLPWRDADSPPIDREQLVVDSFEDPNSANALAAAVVDEYVRYVEHEHVICRGCPVDAHGPFVVQAMLHWKVSYSDGRLGHWTRQDIAEFLLDFFPRKVSGGPDLVLAVPTCVRDLVYFLGDRGTLSAAEVDDLKCVADELADRFAEANLDQSNWGMAKSFFAGDPGSGLLTSGLPRMSMPSPRPGATASNAVQRRKQKAARVARRRNRR